MPRRFHLSRPRWLRPSTRRGQLALITGGTALAVVVLGIIWIVITGLMARSRLNDVKSELSAVRASISSGDTARAKTLMATISSQAHSAHGLTSGPAWWVAANIPELGTPLQTGRTIARQADLVGHDALPGALHLANDLANTRASNSTIDLAPITRAAPVLASAEHTAHAAVTAIDDSDPSWLPYVASARSSVATQLGKLESQLGTANTAVQTILPMLGSSTPQRYFIGFLNEAESRGVGGIPGAYAIATADHGHITFEHFGSDDDLAGIRADVDLGPEYNTRYSQDDPTGTIQNSDISPDFRDAGQIWAGMWEKKTGEHVDGAIGIDPTALSYLLAVTGPATLSDGTQVSAANVVALTQHKQYVLYSADSGHDKAERKAYLNGIAKAVSGRLTKGGNPKALVKALAHATRERRLVLWSAVPAIESRLEGAGIAGVLGVPEGTPYSGFSVSNAAGSKLDFYLARRFTYVRTGCGPGATAVATLALTNQAPTHGLPKYVTIRVDKPPAGAKPGDNRVLVTYFGSVGSTLKSIELDGKRLPLVAGTENGLLAVTADVELPAGQTRTLTVTTVEPTANHRVEFLEQPLVHRLAVKQGGPTCR